MPIMRMPIAGSGIGNRLTALAVFLVATIYLIQRFPVPEFLLQSDDQGYQLALGMAVTPDHWPAFDFVTQYGPMVALLSAAAYQVTGNVLGDLVLSATGFAACAAIGFFLLAATGKPRLGILTACALILTLPRFYKWYYALIPLLGCVLAWKYLLAGSPRRRRIIVLLWSQLVGVSFLIRYDLGLHGLVLGIASNFLADVTQHRPRSFRYTVTGILAFGLLCLLIPLGFSFAIVTLRSAGQLRLWLLSCVSGTADSVDNYGISPFQFHWSSPFASANRLAVMQVWLPVYCFVIAAWTAIGLIRRRQVRREEFLASIVALCGLGICPQAYHRADAPHMMQVIYPLVLLTFIELGRLFASGPRQESDAPFRGAAAAFSLLLVVGSFSWGQVDQGPLFRSPYGMLRIVMGLPYTQPNNPIADIATVLRRTVKTDETVFLLTETTQMPLLFFGSVRQPGLFPTYEQGMYRSRFWLEANARSLAASPPTYIILDKASGNDVAPYIPSLVDDWRGAYRRRLYENTRFVLYAR